MREKRIAYLDMVKGVGIILVVAGHSEYLAHNVFTVITSFHMPLFFIVSGMLICHTGEEKRSFGQILSRKWKSLMLPYGIFSVIYLLIYGGYFHCLSGKLSVEQIREIVIQAVSLDGISVLWFLSALFFAQLIFLALRQKTGKICTIVLSALLALSACYLKPWFFSILPTGTLWGQWLSGFMYMLFRTAAGTGFLALGYATMEGLEKLDASRKSTERLWRELLAGILCLVLTLFLSLYNGDCDLRYLLFHHLPVYVLCAYLGSMGIIFICRSIPAWKWLCFLGANSLTIMLTHLDCQYMFLSMRAGMFLASLSPRAKKYCFYLGFVLCMTGLELGTIYIVKHVRKVIKRN